RGTPLDRDPPRKGPAGARAACADRPSTIRNVAVLRQLRGWVKGAAEKGVRALFLSHRLPALTTPEKRALTPLSSPSSSGSPCRKQSELLRTRYLLRRTCRVFA